MVERHEQYAGRVLDSRWTPDILAALAEGTGRFGELQRALGQVRATVLLPRLKEFERRGLVAKRIVVEGPPGIAYELTPAGVAVLAVRRQ